MHSDQDDIEEFRRLLARGSIQRAYRALLSYMTRLRAHFENDLADCAVSDLYQGYLDITHFAIFPSLLKQHNLKIAIVFNYEAFRFEAWLAGRNRKVQRQYWELFKGRPWPKYRVVTPATGIDSILECDLASDFDLDETDALTSIIETTTVAFINDIERFLSEDQRKRSAPRPSR
jgi:hypothetical protein